MKAFRNVAGNVVEVDVDVGPDGKAILPPDTTIDPKPEAQEGHYVTVVGNAWVQIPVPVQFVAFETEKELALQRLRDYRDWYINSPAEYAGELFDADEMARNRLIQALVIYQNNGYLPPVWVTHDNKSFEITDITALTNLISTIQNAFSTRFYETNTVRSQILAAQTKEELDAIVIPNRSDRVL